MPHEPKKPLSRRRFLEQAGAVSLAYVAGRSLSNAGSAFPASARTPLEVIQNRSPLRPNAFYLLPLGSIRPRGWLQHQLRVQANGLSGHLDETWPDAGPNSGWLGGAGESWERGPYFLDGLVALAYILDDAHLKAKAQKFVDWTLDSQTPDGMMGPRKNDDWWPRMVMAKALTQYCEATADPRVAPFLSRYFAYQLTALPARPLRDWGKYRWYDEVLSILWLYNRTGEPKLLDLARLLHEQGYDWESQFADFKYTERITLDFLKARKNTEVGLQTHGVNNAQALKAAPVWSVVSGTETDRRALFTQLAALDRYHGLPNGMFSADENFAGRNPSQGIELCAVVEAMFSIEQSLAILGEGVLGDRLECIAFNALPGTFTDDMWAHQYNQEPNQVECSLHQKPWATDGPESNIYGLEPNFGCCTANFHQGWPKFTASLVMFSADGGLAAAAYAPCEVNTVVRGTPVRLVEETDYPFRGTVRFTVHPSGPLAFPFHLRIPAWAEKATVRVNGRVVTSPPVSKGFAKIERLWTAGDSVEVDLPLVPRLSRGYGDSVSVQRGPVVFSYGIGESWVKLRDRGMTADWQVYPATQWNYALNVDVEKPEESVSVSEVDMSASGPAGPFTRKLAPVRLQVKARKLPDWCAEDGAADPVPPSPASSDQPEESITLIPYAAAKLRITSFPLLKKG